MRGVFGLGASALAGLAVQPPFEGLRRWLARTLALLWLLATIWIAVLLLWYQANVRASGPPPGIEQVYVGLTATVYHLVGLYGGLLLVLLAAFGPVGWLEIRRSRADERNG